MTVTRVRRKSRRPNRREGERKRWSLAQWIALLGALAACLAAMAAFVAEVSRLINF